MATAYARNRCRERLARLADSSLDTEAVQQEAIADLQQVIGFDRWCWPLGDPQSLIPLGGIALHDYGPQVGRGLELEFSGADFAAMDAVAQWRTAAGSLSAATHGDLARSLRWDEVLRPVGIGDEAVLACRDETGCWGWIKAYRNSGERSFDEDDLELLVAVGPSLATALRRRIHAGSNGAACEPGVIVLDADLRPAGWTAAARDWIDAMGMAALFAAWGILPPVVYALGALARTGDGTRRAQAVHQSAGGGWVRIEAARLEGWDDGRIALSFTSPGPAEMFELLCRAHALSARERELVAALTEGLDTKALAERLAISPHTVQDHLKSIFEKAGVRSRRELLARFGGASA
jgi:DNA-binding CsgD family transcriptional regulator